jgi:hypothetical protein
MSWIEKKLETGKTFERQPDLRAVESEDVMLESALKDFRDSIHAWSDSAMGRPRTVKTEIRRRSWRLAAGWALGCVLVAGGLSGGLFEQHHRQELQRIVAAQKAAADQKELDEQRERAKVSDEVLLAGVDSDVSRDVPSAMEPLAQLMVDDGTK